MCEGFAEGIEAEPRADAVQLSVDFKKPEGEREPRLLWSRSDVTVEDECGVGRSRLIVSIRKSVKAIL